jgi:ribonuclease E
VESTALRVLRGIEEEGQRGRSAAISVKVTPDVAIFMLNKKRQELARIENEYAMSVAFDPDSEVMTGTFEIVRLAQRSPEDRPHRASVSIEAGLATPTDLSEEIEEEEVEEEEEIEEEEEELAEDAATPETSGEHQPQQQDGDGRRRRRRRGGRGRNRNRNERGDRSQNLQEPIPNTAAPNGDSVADDGETSGEANGEFVQDGEGGQRRRRRRRRGRRGRRDEGQQQAYANDLEGVPVDASVRDNDVIVPDETHEPLAAKPNAESAPVWSLGSNQPNAASETPAEPAVAPKKGWWQRAFSSKD